MQVFLEREIAESGMKEDDSQTGRLVRELRAKYGLQRDLEMKKTRPSGLIIHPGPTWGE